MQVNLFLKMKTSDINDITAKFFKSTVSQILLLCCLNYLCFGHALRGTFVFDDTVAIKRNRAINQLPTNMTAIFLSDFWGASITDEESHKSYRPLTSLMFHLEWVKWKLDPFHMKVINLFVHNINTILLLLLLRQLRFSRFFNNKVALLTAVLFAVHPVHTEAVSGIVSRADLMYCFLYLLALLNCSVNVGCEFWLAGIIIFLTIIGVLFKETAIIIPLSCVFIKYSMKQYYALPWKLQLRKLFNITNIFLALSTIIVIVLRLWISEFKSPKFRHADNPIAHAKGFLTRSLSQNYLYVHNLQILLNPLHLSFDWAFGCIKLVETFKDLRIFSIILLYALITICLYNYQNNFNAIFGLCMTIIPFLPASGIIRVGFVIAERVLYVPSIGYCYLVSYGFVLLYEKLKVRVILTISFVILISAFTLRCRQRAEEWLAEDRLFSSALLVCPNNAKVHYNIARLATDTKNVSKAFNHYHKAIELYSEYDAALMNLGNLYREVGNLEYAEKYLERSVKVTPDFATAWMNLGIVQAARKKYKESLKSYKRALKFRKNYANCYYNMGNLYLEQKLYTEALNQWQKAVALNPQFQKAWVNTLTMLDSKNMFEDALRLSTQALTQLPDENSILFLRANIFGKMGRYVEAEQLYRRIITKEPLNYMYHTNLAVLYHRWNKLTDAIDSYKKALNANPEKALTARENLGKLLKRLVNEKQENIKS